MSTSSFDTAKTVVSAIGSVAAAFMVARSVAREYLPPEVQDYLYLGLRNFLNRFSTHLTVVIYEFDGFQNNEMYDAIHLYLSSRLTPDIHRLRVNKNKNEKNIDVAIEINQDLVDYFDGAKLTWILVQKNAMSQHFSPDGMHQIARSNLRYLELTFHRKHKDTVLNGYFPFILEEAKARKQSEKAVKLFTVNRHSGYNPMSPWTSVSLDHPATFETVAMDEHLKESLVEDLKRFVKRREYYRKVGKAWKRGYLLYGPPGTGKSSLIAAMANYLKFDIYDLELTDIGNNSQLRSLLVGTGNRSILVVEDIDCSVELHDREAGEARAFSRLQPWQGHRDDNKVTLSGFLNFIDGLWSSCGDERIIIFTTNRKEKLDPALLRPGRMDVHIHMSYCTPSAFHLLASNYLGITTHKAFKEIDELIGAIEVTPAEVAEQLLKNDDPDIALTGLVEFLYIKRKENEEAKAKAEKEKLEAVAKENENDATKANPEENQMMNFDRNQRIYWPR